MECTPLDTTMGGSCKEYPLQLVLVVIATVTTAVTRRPVLGAVLDVMQILETVATQPHRAATGAVAIMDIRPQTMGAATATNLCTHPVPVDPDWTSESVPWHYLLLGFKPLSAHNKRRPNYHTDYTAVYRSLQKSSTERSLSSFLIA